MDSDSSSQFRDFVERLREGDPQAAAEFWDRYGSFIRRLVRIQLARFDLDDQGLSESRAQSVAVRFLGRWQAGKLEQILADVEGPRQLLGLLREMIHGNLVDWVRRQTAQRRDATRTVPWDPQADARPGDDPRPGPEQALSDQEQLDLISSLMSPDEWQIDQLHRLGCSWQEIADTLGGGRTTDGVRKQHARAITRIREIVRDADE